MKVTPIEKIPEAWTAVVDGRVKVDNASNLNSGKAEITSSDNSKSYMVTWRDEGQIFTSTDSATYWQGYPGYPVIAVLMVLGRLPFDKELADKFSGVEWKIINTKFKNKYSEALEYVTSERKIDFQDVERASQNILSKLIELNLTIKRK